MNKKLYSASIVFFIWAFFSGATIAHGATLTFSPQSDTHAVGDTFTVSVTVSSPDVSVNAFSGEVAFPSDKLQVVSLSKKDSVVNFWDTEPSFTKSSISYEGIALNPGYTGPRGKVLTITFKAIHSGTAAIKFSSASVLVNDGMGTSAISSTGTAVYVITDQYSEPVVDMPLEGGVPVAPYIQSSTHPDQSTWYANHVAQLSWDTNLDTAGVAYLISKNPVGTPSISQGAIKNLATPSLGDGVWYAHIRFRNQAGWGIVGTYTLRIDTTPPVNVVVLTDSDTNSATQSFTFRATDETSGVAQFGVSIDGKSEVFVPATGESTKYVSPQLARGSHTLMVKAYDQAGNFTVYTGSFTVSRLDPPVITDYQKKLYPQDFLVLKGKTYPNANLEFLIANQPPIESDPFESNAYSPVSKSVTDHARSDDNGNFTFAYSNRLAGGLYTISARVLLSDGSSSEPSSSIVIPVTENFFMRVAHFAISLEGIFMVSSVMAIVLLFFITRAYLEYRRLKTKTATLMPPDIRRPTE